MRKKDFGIFITPSLLILAIIVLFPIFYTIYMSLFRGSFVGNGLTFIGLTNYKEILNDSRFWNSLGNTFFLIIIVLPIQLSIGFIFALLLNKIVKFRSFYTGLILMPYILVPVVAALTFAWLFRGTFGILNYFITSIGLKPPEWFADPWLARFLIIIFEIWKFTPFALIILFAGLQSITQQVEEAASIDGANYFGRILWITIPLLRNHILFIITISLMNFFQTFDSVFVLTRGGPGRHTELLAFYNYQVAFYEYNINKSSAIAVLTIFVITITILYFMFEMYKQYKATAEAHLKKVIK